MPIQDFSENIRITDYLNNTSKLEPTIGAFGGIKFSYKDNANSSTNLNEIVKAGMFLAQEILGQQRGYLTETESKQIQDIFDKVNELKKKRWTLLNNSQETSPLQKILTRIRSAFSSLFYDRETALKNMRSSFDQAKKLTEDHFSDILYKARSLNDFSDNSITKFLGELEQQYPLLITPKLLKKLTDIFGCHNPDFVVKNLALFKIDPSTPEGQKIIIDIVTPKAERLSSEPLFLALHEHGLTSIPEIKSLLLKFVGNLIKNAKEKDPLKSGYSFGHKLSVEDLEKLGLDPQQDREVFIQCAKKCMEIGLLRIAFDHLAKLNISPLNNEWHHLIASMLMTAYAPQSWDIHYFLSEYLTKFLDLTKENHLNIFIKFWKIAYKKFPTELRLLTQHLEQYTKLHSYSVETLKIITKITQELGYSSGKNKEDIDFAIFAFLRDNGINGITETEQKYLQWLINDEDAMNFDIHYASQGFTPISLDILKHELIVKLDTKSLMKLLSTTALNPNMQKILWIEWFKRGDRNVLKSGDLADWTKIGCPASTIHNIKKYGSSIAELDLTDVFVFRDVTHHRSDPKQRLEIINSLKTTLSSCPHLKTLRIAYCGFIDDDVISAFPSTLNTLTLGKCDISSSSLEKLPSSISTLVIRDFKLQGYRKENPIKIPENVKTLEIDIPARPFETKYGLKTFQLPAGLLALTYNGKNIKKDEMVKLPDNLQTFSFSSWEGTPQELFSILPNSLKNLTCEILDPPWTVDDIRAIPKNLKLFNLLSPIRLTNTSITELPSCMKRLDVTWDATFDQLLPYLPSTLLELNISELEPSTSLNLNLLPKNLKKLRLEKALSKDMLQGQCFPQNLQLLYIPQWDNTFQELLSHLPKNIETLAIKKMTTKISGADLDLLPKSIKVLALRRHWVIIDEEVTPELRQKMKDKGIDFKTAGSDVTRI